MSRFTCWLRAWVPFVRREVPWRPSGYTYRHLGHNEATTQTATVRRERADRLRADAADINSGAVDRTQIHLIEDFRRRA